MERLSQAGCYQLYVPVIGSKLPSIKLGNRGLHCLWEGISEGKDDLATMAEEV